MISFTWSNVNKEIIAVFLLPVVLAACSHLPPVAPAAAPTATVPAQPAVPPMKPVAPPTPAAALVPAAAPVPPAPPIPASGPVATSASKATDTAVQVKRPAPPKSALTPPKPPPPVSSAAAALQPAPAAPVLNLTSLEQRLRDTRAIGVFTKLSLKNQVDDLLEQFRMFYRGKAALTFADLRQRYDLLMIKVISLLQDSDRALATDIVVSREAIWGILRDPAKFATI